MINNLCIILFSYLYLSFKDIINVYLKTVPNKQYFVKYPLKLYIDYYTLFYEFKYVLVALMIFDFSR